MSHYPEGQYIGNTTSEINTGIGKYHDPKNKNTITYLRHAEYLRMIMLLILSPYGGYGTGKHRST